MEAEKRPHWPRAMRLGTASAYLDLSTAEFLREVSSGVLPDGVRLGRSEHWDRHQIDERLERLTGVASDWRVGSPLYAEAPPSTIAPKLRSEPNVYPSPRLM